MLRLNHLIGFGARRATGTPPSGWHYSTLQSVAGPSASSHTFTAYSIGAAAANRVVSVVIAHGNSLGRTISGVLIGGVTASSVPATQPATGHRAQIWYAVVPTGTTADVEITLSASSAGGLACALFYGYPVSSTPLDSGTSTAASGGVITNSDIAIGVGGILIMCRVGGSGDPTVFAWTGSDSITVHVDGSASGVNYSIASIMTTQTTTTDDLTADPAGSSTNGLCCASFGG